MRSVFLKSCVLLCLPLVACSDSGSSANPLIGEWMVEMDGPLGEAVQKSMPKKLRTAVYTETQMIAQGRKLDITYEIKDAHTVIVHAPKMPDLAHTIFEHDGRTCFRFADPSDPMRFCKTS